MTELICAPENRPSSQSDTTYVQSCFNQAVDQGLDLYIDTRSRPFSLDKPLVVTPPGTEPFGILHVEGIRKRNAYPSFEYKGSADPAISFIGFKTSTFHNLVVRNWAVGASGFFFGTDFKHGSSSGNKIIQCGADLVAESVAGFLVGDDTRAGAGPADVCAMTFDRTFVSGRNKCKDGYYQFGGNTCNIQYIGAMAANVSRSCFHLEGYPLYNQYTNSNGTTLFGCDFGHAPCGFLIAGGSHLSIIGGRSELISGPVVHTLAGGGPGWVKVLGFYPAGSAKPWQADGETIIQVL